MTAPIVVAGNLSLDDVVTPDGAFDRTPGGDALYASLGVRAWGVRPVLLTLVGDDYPADHLRRIEAAGVDASHIRRTDGATVHYRATYQADGSRIFEWISTEDRLLLTSPVAADYDGALTGAAWLHLAAMPIEAHEVGIAAGRAAGVPMSIDPHEEYVVGYEERLARLVEGVVFLPSELEVRLLFPDLAALEALPFAFAAAERLDPWRPVLVAIKLGALGSVVRADGRSVHVPATAVPVVDPTGAGDAYCGGFVIGRLLSGSAIVAAACGTVAAGETIGIAGAFRDGVDQAIGDRLRATGEILERLLAEDLDPGERRAAMRRLAERLEVTA